MTGALGIFVGGGLGSILRWGICNRINTHWGVLLVNIVGAFCIGCAYAYFSKRTDLTPEIRMFIITGMLGGFTTFSTYLLDFVNLASNGRVEEAFVYFILSAVIGVMALLSGLKMVELYL